MTTVFRALLTTDHMMVPLHITSTCGCSCCQTDHDKSKSAVCQYCRISTHSPLRRHSLEGGSKLYSATKHCNLQYQNRSPPISRLNNVNSSVPHLWPLKSLAIIWKIFFFVPSMHVKQDHQHGCQNIKLGTYGQEL